MVSVFSSTALSPKSACRTSWKAHDQLLPRPPRSVLTTSTPTRTHMLAQSISPTHLANLSRFKRQPRNPLQPRSTPSSHSRHHARPPPFATLRTFRSLPGAPDLQRRPRRRRPSPQSNLIMRTATRPYSDRVDDKVAPARSFEAS